MPFLSCQGERWGPCDFLRMNINLSFWVRWCPPSRLIIKPRCIPLYTLCFGSESLNPATLSRAHGRRQLSSTSWTINIYFWEFFSKEVSKHIWPLKFRNLRDIGLKWIVIIAVLRIKWCLLPPTWATITHLYFNQVVSKSTNWNIYQNIIDFLDKDYFLNSEGH